jgi:hypothetical protein
LIAQLSIGVTWFVDDGPLVVDELARKLLIALWQLVRQGVVPDGVVLRPAQ